MAIFEGRTAVVTGGSRGIGRAICHTLAEHGARVAINDRENEAAAQETLASVEAAGAEGLPVQANVLQKDQVDRMMAAVRDHFGPIDLLVNNAAIGAVEDHDAFGFYEWRRMFEATWMAPSSRRGQ